jgi:uncharacterized protein with von Willebrand factor type A (vWA) domain
VIFVGDAAMNPYELTAIDGSAEYRNIEPGITWLEPNLRPFPRSSGGIPSRRGRGNTRATTQLILQALGPGCFR